MPVHRYATLKEGATEMWRHTGISVAGPDSTATIAAGASLPALPFDSTPVIAFGQKLLRMSGKSAILSVRKPSRVEFDISENRDIPQDGDAIDRELMLRVAARDQRAFATLAERHARTALALAQRIVRNTADAEDVVQESLTRLWTFADRWNPETARFTSWFYRIVTNQAISRLRRKTTESIDAVEEPSDPTPGPHDRLAGYEIGRAIAGAIGRLPDRQRAAIALAYDQNLSCAEAAETMGVSVGTMESLLFRARRSLREWLGPLSAELEER